jgi:plasmid rolling circle replication initiator protein Rep
MKRQKRLVIKDLKRDRKRQKVRMKRNALVDVVERFKPLPEENIMMIIAG